MVRVKSTARPANKHRSPCPFSSRRSRYLETASAAQAYPSKTSTTGDTAASLAGNCEVIDSTRASDDGEELTVFTLFPQLPIELRHMIWDEVLPGPRVIEILYRRSKRQVDTDCENPMLLYVNQESRNLTLKNYKTMLVEHEKQRCPRRIQPLLHRYINNDQDLLYLFVSQLEDMASYSFDGSGFSDLQHVAVDLSEIHGKLTYLSGFARFSELKTLSLVGNGLHEVGGHRPALAWTKLALGDALHIPSWDGEQFVKFTTSDIEKLVPSFKGALAEEGADEAMMQNLDFMGIKIIRDGDMNEEQDAKGGVEEEQEDD
ncbi:hypothetical protein BDZ45DRAFT_724856 [Acephala macrosclerotiorum]|nr:hypothetical protein BDZ45DRAFT_724856 [Acephala macrosclerotiorum]